MCMPLFMQDDSSDLALGYMYRPALPLPQYINQVLWD